MLANQGLFSRQGEVHVVVGPSFDGRRGEQFDMAIGIEIIGMSAELLRGRDTKLSAETIGLDVGTDPFPTLLFGQPRGKPPLGVSVIFGDCTPPSIRDGEHHDRSGCCRKFGKMDDRARSVGLANVVVHRVAGAIVGEAIVCLGVGRTDADFVDVLQIRSQREDPRFGDVAIVRRFRESSVVGVAIIVHPQADLLEVIRILDPSRRLPYFLNRWQKQTNQDGDDRNDYEKFDERETTTKRHARMSYVHEIRPC